jgi:hypothetical protein
MLILSSLPGNGNQGNVANDGSGDENEVRHILLSRLLKRQALAPSRWNCPGSSDQLLKYLLNTNLPIEWQRQHFWQWKFYWEVSQSVHRKF